MVDEAAGLVGLRRGRGLARFPGPRIGGGRGWGEVAGGPTGQEFPLPFFARQDVERGLDAARLHPNVYGLRQEHRTFRGLALDGTFQQRRVAGRDRGEQPGLPDRGGDQGMRPIPAPRPVDPLGIESMRLGHWSRAEKTADRSPCAVRPMVSGSGSPIGTTRIAP